MKTECKTKSEAIMATDYIVKDISLADFGRKELDIAETEMPIHLAQAKWMTRRLKKRSVQR
jgi:S-adenosylhomocysteine hydrolase